MRAGDVVKHIPSEEAWYVACVSGEHLFWCGWPPGCAKVSDCVLTKECTDEEHREMLERWIVNGDYNCNDSRHIICREQLFELNKGFIGAGV